MSIPSFESQREAWSNPPVDDVGYISSESLMKLDDDELLEMIQTMETTRYSGWRNEGNMWREVLGLDSTHDKACSTMGAASDSSPCSTRGRKPRDPSPTSLVRI